MFKKSEKFLVLVLTLIMLISIFSISSFGEEHSFLKGKKIEMSILGIGGWLPSKLGVEMSPLFSKYAKEEYGYDVTFSFQEAPFSSLFQKAATSFAAKSQEYNIIISDSQWLGAFAEPGWIVKLNDVIKENPELDIEWGDPVIKEAYMTYPDGSDQLWGMGEEGDVLVLYVRKDMLQDPKEQKAFKEKYGFDLPQTYDDFIPLTMDKYEKMCEFFTRPDERLYGVATQFSKEYDYMTGSLYPFIWSTGGEIWDEKTRNVWGILNTPNNAKALERMVGLQKYAPPGVQNYGNAEISDVYAKGMLFSAFQWAAVGNAMLSTPELRDETLIVPIPGFIVNGKLKRVSSVGGQPWVVNKFNDKEHMQVAIDFLKWWYMTSTQLEFARRGGNPVTKAAIESPGFENIQPWFKAYKYSLTQENARDFWHEAKYSEMLSLQQAAFTAYATGQVKDTMKVLDYVAYYQQKILYEAGRTKTPPPASYAGIELK